MIGESVGAYNIVSELGRGGMGVVYLAEHRHMGRKAAIKFLMPELSERADRLQRFFLEARAASLVEHDGIVRVFDCDIHPSGSAYIVMEYLAGHTLQAFLAARRGLLPPSEAAAIMLRVADALAAAHDKGIVHRDLKPENIFVLSYPPGGIKVVDFGVAKLSQAVHDAPSRTQSGALLGTPLYMSPEQALGSALVDGRADVYAMGCMLFEMLMGHPPFTHPSARELLTAHLGQRPPPVDATVPAALRGLVEGMLAKSPGDRPGLREHVIPILQGASTGRAVVFEGLGAVTAILPPFGQAAPLEGYAPVVGAMPAQASHPNAPDLPRWSGGKILGVLVVLGALGGVAAWLEPWQKRGLTDVAISPDQAAPPAAPAPAAKTPAPAEPRASVPPPAPAAVPPPAPAPRSASSPPRAPARSSARGKTVASRRAAVAPRARAALTDAPAPAVRFSLSSDPPGSLVCLPSVATRVGFTNGPVALKNGAERTTFILYRAGYHLERVTVTADAPPRMVKLRPLTEDDLAPLPPCR